MPIVDWTRTQLDFELPTEGLALKFNYLHIIIFEMFILKLKNLEQRYSKKQITNAEILYKKMKSKDLNDMKLIVNESKHWVCGIPLYHSKCIMNPGLKMEMKHVRENLKKNGCTTTLNACSFVHYLLKKD